MNLLKKLTNKNLQLNKKRTIVTIIGIMLSVALITAVATMYVSLYKSIINYETSLKGNFHVSFTDVGQEDLKYFKENRYIEEYHLIEPIGYAKLEGSANESKPYLYVMGYTKDSMENLTVNLINGRLPENDHEIVIANHVKTNGRVEYHIGDKITLNIGKRVTPEGEELNQFNPYQNPENNLEDENYSEELVDTKEYTYTVVGIIERPSNYVEDYAAPGYSCITLNDNPTNNVEVYARFNKKGVREPEKVIASILGIDVDKFTRYYNGKASEQEAQEIEGAIQNSKFDVGYINQYLLMLEKGILSDPSFRSIGMIAGVVCLIIIATSVFCIKNSFDISISEKTKQYGMLSSIGATKKQIKKNVYYEAYKLGIIGIPLGIILGLIASAILILICNLLLKDMINTNMVLSISIMSIIFGIILGIVTIFFSSLRSAHKAAKITPISAIRNSDDIKIKSKKIKSPKSIKKLFGIGGEISYKNLQRSKKKYRTTVISIIVSVAVFIALSTFMSTFYQFIVIEYSAKDYNISVQAGGNNIESVEEKMETIVNRDDVNDYSIEESEITYIKNVKASKEYKEYLEDERTRFNYYEDNNDQLKDYDYGQISFVSIGEHQYKKYLKELNLDYETNKNKLIMLDQIEIYNNEKNKMIKLLPFNYKKGDKITLGKMDYDEEGNRFLVKNVEYEIAVSTTKRPFGFSSIPSIPIVIVSDETYREMAGEKVYYQNYYFDVKDPDKFQDDIETILKGEDIRIYNVAQDQKQMKSFHLLMAIFLYGFITVISLIGITNIFNTITTNMELRKREFATLKSIGMTSKEFNRMISLESFFYGTKSLLIGIPIGIVLSILLYKLLNNDMVVVKYQIPYLPIIISIIAVFVLITVIMKFSISKINKQNTIETIRNENI